MPSAAPEVETGARTLSAQTEITEQFLDDIIEFSGDAERLSAGLREAGVTQDLPCIFHGIAEDARDRVADFRQPIPPRNAKPFQLRVLLDDAILIAPMAAAAAADRAAEQQQVATN
ncbi:MAG: hypothetical protein R3C16_04635 [Hyphomonadaceae bacterium]